MMMSLKKPLGDVREQGMKLSRHAKNNMRLYSYYCLSLKKEALEVSNEG